MATYRYKKDDLKDNKEKTLKNIKGARQYEKELKKERERPPFVQDWELSDKPTGHKDWYDLPSPESNTKGINHGERRGEKGGRYNQRTSKKGTSYRQYF